MAAEDLARKHARQDDVVSKLRLPGTFGPGIDLAKGLADDVEWLSVVAACHYKIQPQINTDLDRSENYLLRAVVRSFYLCYPCSSVARSHSSPNKLSRGSSI